MNILIKKLDRDNLHEFSELVLLFANVFEMTTFSVPAVKHLKQLLEKEDFIVFAAAQNNKIVGGLTAYTLTQYYSELPLAFIYDIAVKPEVQRQGIGKALVLALENFCRESGYEEMFVLADDVDEHALEFYRSTGASESRVVNFNYSLVI